MSAPEFREFGKIPRLNREVVVTEKIDGTNGCVIVTDDGQVFAQSRSRLIYPGNDNFGFAGWVERHKDQLLDLGPGHHYGEWWGLGIQRGYGMTERKFSLFNTYRWSGDDRPECCDVVPIIVTGALKDGVVDKALDLLREVGSFATPYRYSNPEGVIVYHTAARSYFKATLEKDDSPKGGDRQ